MRKDSRKELMAPVLDDLDDDRLARLLSKDGRHCALQLWVLQIEADESIENRVMCGRLLPYSHSDDRWSGVYEDRFQTFGRARARIIRLNLYVKSDHCADLLRLLSAGQTVSAISEELELGLSDQLKARFGATALAADGVVYRPVAYLLNRDGHDRHSTSSPHGGAGAFSASINQTDKEALFGVGHDYDVALTALVVKHLNADTGLDFGGGDTARFGDLELLIFPTLDDLERPLLSVSWTDAPARPSRTIQSNAIAAFQWLPVPPEHREWRSSRLLSRHRSRVQWGRRVRMQVRAKRPVTRQDRQH